MDYDPDTEGDHERKGDHEDSRRKGAPASIYFFKISFADSNVAARGGFYVNAPCPGVWPTTTTAAAVTANVDDNDNHSCSCSCQRGLRLPTWMMTTTAAAAAANVDDNNNNSCSCSCQCRPRRQQQQLRLPTRRGCSSCQHEGRRHPPAQHHH